MATAKPPVEVNARERVMLAFALGLAIASKKRMLNAPTTSDEMKVVIQTELSDFQALWIKMQ